MGIAVLDGQTHVSCDVCKATISTDRADGVVPSEWMTGHLWLDISLSMQKQTPLCFCPVCRVNIADQWRIVVGREPEPEQLSFDIGDEQ
jgi:hypothetical protein